MTEPKEQKNNAKRKADEANQTANKVPKLNIATDGTSSGETEYLQQIAAVRQEIAEVNLANQRLKTDIARKNKQLAWSEAENIEKARLLRLQARKFANWRARCSCEVFEPSLATTSAQEETQPPNLMYAELEDDMLPCNVTDVDEDADF